MNKGPLTVRSRLYKSCGIQASDWAYPAAFFIQIVTICQLRALNPYNLYKLYWITVNSWRYESLAKAPEPSKDFTSSIAYTKLTATRHSIVF